MGIEPVWVWVMATVYQGNYFRGWVVMVGFSWKNTIIIWKPLGKFWYVTVYGLTSEKYRWIVFESPPSEPCLPISLSNPCINKAPIVLRRLILNLCFLSHSNTWTKVPRWFLFLFLLPRLSYHSTILYTYVLKSFHHCPFISDHDIF